MIGNWVGAVHTSAERVAVTRLAHLNVELLKNPWGERPRIARSAR